jgi:tricorn protease
VPPAHDRRRHLPCDPLVAGQDGSLNDKMRLSFVDVGSKAVGRGRRRHRRIVEFAGRPTAAGLPTLSELEPDPDHLYSVESRKTIPVTDTWYDSTALLGRDGKHLIFVSDRDFNPVYSATEWNHAYLAMSRVYFVTLSKDAKSPFEPKSDEVAVKPAEEAKAAAPAKPGKPAEKPAEKTPAAAPTPVKVDPDGLMDRIVALPIETANYGGINAVGDSVYYAKFKPGDREPSLMFYDLAELRRPRQVPLRLRDLGKRRKMLIFRTAPGIIDLPKG